MAGVARKLRVLFAGAIYHVMFRGNARQRIFHGDGDRERILWRLAASANTYQVDVYLYCLMNNHVHLLVCTPLGNLDRFMSSLLTGYTVYFNRRHDSVGHVLQGRYKAQVVAGDEYLLKLSRYLHLNPVFIGAWKRKPAGERLAHLRQYRWSSYPAYLGQVKAASWLKTGPLLALGQRFGEQRGNGYGQYVEAGLVREDADQALWAGNALALGDAAFVEEIRRRYEQACAGRQREDVDLRPARKYRSADLVWQKGLEVCQAEESLMQARKRGAVARGLMAWALQRHAGLTQRQVAERLGLTSGAAVSLLLRRLEQQASSAMAGEVAKWQQKVNLLFKG